MDADSEVIDSQIALKRTLRLEEAYRARLQHIQDHPREHIHFDIDRLQNCCMVLAGRIEVLDLQLIDLHAQFAPLGSNGGRNCDVMSGPCSCSAWH